MKKLDIVVVEKKIITIEYEADKKPTKKSLLKLLNDVNYHDILEEETIEYLEVLELGEDKGLG